MTSSLASIAIASVSTVDRYRLIHLAEMPLRILDAAERRSQREVKHSEQRQHDENRHQARLLNQKNQAERDGGGREVTQ